MKLYGSAEGLRVSGPAPFSVANYFDKWRKRINDCVLARFQKDSAALISSVTTGETSYFGDDLKDAFNSEGLAHILSISGTHFGLFSVKLFGMFVFLTKRLPYVILHREVRCKGNLGQWQDCLSGGNAVKGRAQEPSAGGCDRGPELQDICLSSPQGILYS